MQLRMLLYSGGLFIVLLLLLTGVVVAMTKAFTRQNAMELGELTAAVEDLSKNGGAVLRGVAGALYPLPGADRA